MIARRRASVLLKCSSLDVLSVLLIYIYIYFFFNDTATTEIYTLSLHDALPISENNQLIIHTYMHHHLDV